MKIQEKLKFLQDNHLGEWIRVYRETENELSGRQSMFCVCGKLATGLHESYCRKFKGLVTKKTLEKLSHLIVKI